MALVDENAYGILIGYHSIEDDEYGLERYRFVERFNEFRTAVLDYLTTLRVAEKASVLDFGHAVYIEFADGDQREDPLAWGKAARSLLVGREFQSIVVVTHGSRWVDENQPDVPEAGELAPQITFAKLSHPSEPLRRAIAAEVASRRADEDDERGWGPGLYVDDEAIEALGRQFKNAPTPLEVGGATYFRVGR
jgi:hypothetical protein